MGNIKSYKNFIKDIKKQLVDYYGDSAVIDVIDVLKNNGKKVDAINIVLKDESSQMSPIIYLEPIYEDYKSGESVDNCIQKILGIMNDHVKNEEVRRFDSIVKNWEVAKKSIYPMLINTEENKELLQKYVSFPFFDLCIIFVLRGSDTPQGTKNVKITRDLLNIYKVTPEELKKQAMSNLKKDGYCFKDIIDIINSFMGEKPKELGKNELETGKIYVLTNESSLFGAAGLLYEELFESTLGDKNAYILPSSIHEVLICPEDEGMEPKYFTEMIREINSNVLSETDVLSDHPYYYDGSIHKVLMCA